MRTKPLKISLLSFALPVLLFACGTGGQKQESYDIPMNTDNPQATSMPENAQKSMNSIKDEIHKAVALEVLPAKKYVYVRVKENGEEYWIAAMKTEVTPGNTYYFREGVMKTDYESKEYNRLFKKIYLVPSLVSEKHGLTNNPAPSMSKTAENTAGNPSGGPTEPIVKKGSVSIAELVNNADKYQGQTVQVTGRCVKINPNIMKRNWIHLKDGSKDDFDLVVTSQEFVKEGETVTFKATVALKKDFGAGYYYDLILENGVRAE